MGGITLRLSDYEFKAADRDGHGRSWPIQHRDLAPWYQRLEALLQVHGHCDGLAQLPDGHYKPPCRSHRRKPTCRPPCSASWGCR